VNRDRILARLDETKAAGADLVLFPEALKARLAIVALLAAALAPASSVAATGTVRADDPASLSVQVARWNVLHQFDRVWQTIDPRDRRVTTRNFWESCKKKIAPEGLKVKSLTATSRQVTIGLPPLGRVKVTVVTLKTRYTLPTLSGVRTAITTIFWTRSSGHWKGLWSASDYRAYSHHRCPAP
jgi:hypothetical protein